MSDINNWYVEYLGDDSAELWSITEPADDGPDYCIECGFKTKAQAERTLAEWRREALVTSRAEANWNFYSEIACTRGW